MSWRAQCHSTLYSFKNYTKVIGANFAVVKVVVVLVVKEVVVGRSRRVSLPPVAPLCGPVVEAAPAAAQSTSHEGDRRALDDQVQACQPDVW